jgi:hypothetical protein
MVTGAAPQGGGRYGGRLGGHEASISIRGGSRETESAVLQALRCLARAQREDGSWAGSDDESGLAATSLSLLAFLGAGHTQLSQEEGRGEKGVLVFGSVVKKACLFLIASQTETGLIGEAGPRSVGDHALAAQALSEAYGMTRSVPLREAAQKAIDWLISAGKGTEGAPGGDLAGTVWATLALKSAESAGLTVPPQACEGALHWIRTQADPRRGSVGDASKSLLSVLLVDKQRSDPILTSMSRVWAELPEWKEGKTDLRYWFFGSQLIFHYEGGDGNRWKQWNEAMKTALLPHQDKDGSWNPVGAKPGANVGRTVSTALGALTLEIYYRTSPIVGSAAPRR